MTDSTDNDRPDPATDGGTDHSQRLESASDGVNEQLENIRQTRRQRALGWLAGVAALVFILLQGLAATEFFDDGTEFTWSHFSGRMGDYFPVTDYGGIPFLDVGRYWEFIWLTT